MITAQEDLDVWYWVARKFSDSHGCIARAWNTLGTTIRDGDKRDADLMYRAQFYRSSTIGVMILHNGDEWVNVGGYTQV